jgi:crotonobetainyl-CoA:carnitine CoA-transferase CaiB-like acyl-CoA transferase
MVAPLAGIKVVEVANWLAAPSCAALMRDMGAEVIKVEPPGGDTWRHTAERDGRAPQPHPTTYAFELDNRGKRSITVDLGKPGGPELVRRLTADADVFITNLIQPRRVAFGLTDIELMQLFPRLIYVSLSGYGIEGPEAGRAAYDYSAFWTRSGIMSLLTRPEDAPVVCRTGQGDHATALNLLAATLAALRARDMTGEGQFVDITLVGTGVWTIGSDVSNVLQIGEQPATRIRTQPPSPLTNTYRTADGRWILMIMNPPDRYWPRFVRCFRHPEWETDPRFERLAVRRQNSKELVAMVDAEFAMEPFDYWAQRMDEHGLIWAPAQNLPEVTQDPTIRGLGTFTRIEESPIGPYETLSAPFHIRGADIAVRGPAPLPGEHTQEVLQEYGFDDGEIAELAADGVFG